MKNWMVIDDNFNRHTVSADETTIEEGCLIGFNRSENKKYVEQIWAFAQGSWTSVFPVEEKMPVKINLKEVIGNKQ